MPRGVSVRSSIIRTLQEREWIRVVGHRDIPGKPALFGTTRAFLDYFNLASLDDLPSLAEIRDMADLEPELDLEPPRDAEGDEFAEAEAAPGNDDSGAEEPPATDESDADPDEAAPEAVVDLDTEDDGGFDDEDWDGADGSRP